MQSRKAILLVEGRTKDGPLAREAFDELGLGKGVIQSATAPEALTYLRGCTTDRPGVILLGVDGVNGEGLDTLRAIKEDEQLRTIPVVVFGPSGDGHIVDESFGLGAAGYVATSADSGTFSMAMRTVYEYWSLSELPK